MSKQKLLRQLVRSARVMVQGGLSETTRRCGNPGCICQRDATQRHGPRLYLTYRSEAKNRALYVPAEHAEEVRRGPSALLRPVVARWEVACAMAAANRELAVTPDGQGAVSASFAGELKVWDLASGNELCTLRGHSNAVRAVAVLPDGQRAVSASDDQTLKVWDLAGGRDLRTLTGHVGEVRAVAVLPDGQRAVSASSDRMLKVWDLERGEVLATFTCDSATVCCAFSDALELIFASDAGGHVRFLHLEERKLKPKA